MVRVLVLTKNILAEEILATKLQHLNYEFFCSTSILEELQATGQISEFVNYFPIVIIGENISSYEMELLLPKLQAGGQSILREVDHLLTEDEKVLLTEKGLHGFVQSSDSIELLREQLAEVATQYQGKPFEPVHVNHCFAGEKERDITSLTLVNLSSLELQVLKILRDNSGEIVSRDELCRMLWGDISQSRLAQLSSLVKNIKLKLECLETDQEIVQTIWGKGYRVRNDVAIQTS
ncbi:MAG: helix-turn-helix domain-containing protein [Enterococcus sp.]|uniref:winged helix-turn-helix domain-containing protein n=1 Tax=Enterococcus sp. TaxID=35783 RepID=UPI002FC83A6C